MSSPDRCDCSASTWLSPSNFARVDYPPTRPRAKAGKVQALADPTRLTLAAALLEANELCVCDLAWIAERSQTLLPPPGRVVRPKGIVPSRRDGKMGFLVKHPACVPLILRVGSESA